MASRAELNALLSWYLEAGIDDISADQPIDRFAASLESRPVNARNGEIARQTRPPEDARPAPKPSGAAKPTAHPPALLIDEAQSAALAAANLGALETALATYEGCALKRTAMSLVFADGPQKARLMVIGDAPGAEDDRSGIPYSGPGGLLLDQMLAAIGLSRQTDVHLAMLVPWRPPGNRPPNEKEIAHCLPFLRRHIALVEPQIVLCLGGVAASALSQNHHTITKLRGRWQKLTHALFSPEHSQNDIAMLTSWPPDMLLKQPRLKADAWADLLSLRLHLEKNHAPLNGPDE
jgi:DNA polymerase